MLNVTINHRELKKQYIRNVCCFTMNPANDTVSWPRVPPTSPLPYWRVTSSLPDGLKDDDLVESYLDVREGH
jgi:hypothetical protein